VQFWTDIPLNSATDAENISVLNPLEMDRPVQNLIPITLVTIIARLVWIIYFFAEGVVSTKQEEAAFPS
jgi:hypothetical protein